MAPLTQAQRRPRARAALHIRIMAHALHLMPVAGVRLSRLVERSADAYYPPQRASVPPPPAERQRASDNA